MNFTAKYSTGALQNLPYSFSWYIDGKTAKLGKRAVRHTSVCIKGYRHTLHVLFDCSKISPFSTPSITI